MFAAKVSLSFPLDMHRREGRGASCPPGGAGRGAGAAAGYITLVPVVGVAVSALLLHEALDTSLLIGGTLAVLGTAIMQRGRR